MKKLMSWGLWLLGCLVIIGAFVWAPLAQSFLGQSSRILFFHVPMAWTSFVAFIAAGIWSVRYLAFGRRVADDLAAQAAVELGLVLCVLATVTGAMWAKTMWGEFWNWDPRQTSITFALLFYAAYVALRQSLPDAETRRRLSGAYAALGLAVAPFLFFVAPRIVYSLHPQPVLNSSGKVEMESRMFVVLMASLFTFTVLFFWLHNLYRRALQLFEDGANLDRATLEGSPTERARP